MNAIDNLDTIIKRLQEWLKRYPFMKLPNAQKNGLESVLNNIIAGGRMSIDDWGKLNSAFYEPQQHNNPINDFTILVNEVAKWLMDSPIIDVSKKTDKLSSLLSVINEREAMTVEEESDITFEIKEIKTANVPENLWSKIKAVVKKEITTANNELKPDPKKIDTLLKLKEWLELRTNKTSKERSISESKKMNSLMSDGSVTDLLESYLDAINPKIN